MSVLAPYLKNNNEVTLPAMSGSTLGVKVIKIPKPLAALLRSVSLEESARPRANVL